MQGQADWPGDLSPWPPIPFGNRKWLQLLGTLTTVAAPVAETKTATAFLVSGIDIWMPAPFVEIHIATDPLFTGLSADGLVSITSRQTGRVLAAQAISKVGPSMSYKLGPYPLDEMGLLVAMLPATKALPAGSFFDVHLLGLPDPYSSSAGVWGAAGQRAANVRGTAVS